MNNARRHIEAIYNIQIDVTKEADNMTTLELDQIKQAARNLYDNLVWLHYEAEGREDE